MENFNCICNALLPLKSKYGKMFIFETSLWFCVYVFYILKIFENLKKNTKTPKIALPWIGLAIQESEKVGIK